MTELLSLLFAGSVFFGGNIDIESPSGRIFPPPDRINRTVEITAQSALIVDVETGMILFEKNAHEQRAPASLTKIMTALLLLESGDLEKVVRVSSDATVVEGSKMKLKIGERITRRNLLSGLLIRSANDAAIAIAIDEAGNLPQFVERMNRRARFLGLSGTHFENPHGLDAPNHFSTAFDLALLARKLLTFDEVRALVQMREKTVLSVDGAFAHFLKNTNELLWSDFPVYGLKTGTTDEAGQCLVALIREGHREFLIVVLGSTDRFTDTKALLWALENRGEKN